MWMAIKRGIVVAAGVMLQLAFSISVFLFFRDKAAWIETIYRIIGVLIVLAIVKGSKRLSADLPWVILILAVPVFGALLYLILGRSYLRSDTLKRIHATTEESRRYLRQDEALFESVDTDKRGQLKYIANKAGYPATTGNEVKYYALGEDVYPVMLEKLERAEEFIFMEYFIIRQDSMWQGILDILERKAKAGLDVRLIYDDMGCITMLPTDYPKQLEAKGIKCYAFNKLTPVRGVIMNNRDHRKMTIIDGKTVFSGGINLADEYININPPYGQWKDNGIMIQGPAVWNYTVMFLAMWNAWRQEDHDYTVFYRDFPEHQAATGLVAPYGDSPLDDEIVGENVYLNILNQARDYVWIYTPYLIIDSDMINALILAASRGVDVRIIAPGIPDKKMVYGVTKSYFEALIRGGVSIYTYTPGFVHSKVFVCDDEIATVGTINMDYRSLYLHFECGNYLYQVAAIADIKADLEAAFAVSHRVSIQEATPKPIQGLWQAILRLFAPLM